MASWSDHEDKELEFHEKRAEGNSVSLPMPHEGPALAVDRGVYIARIDQALAAAKEERTIFAGLEDDYQSKRKKRNAIVAMVAGVILVPAAIGANMLLDQAQGIDDASLKERSGGSKMFHNSYIDNNGRVVLVPLPENPTKQPDHTIEK